LVYGLPDAELGAAAERGEVALGGCVIDAGREEWQCDHCGNRWVAAEGGLVAADLSSLTRELRAGTVDRIDVRPRPAIGTFFRIDIRLDTFRARLMPNIYWPVDCDADMTRRLKSVGWDMSSLDPRREWPSRDDWRLVDELSALLADLGSQMDDAYVSTSPDDPEIPKGPHAVMFWDWKDAPPFEEFTEVSDALLAAGAERVVFNPVETAEDTYGLVIADRELSPLQSLEVWNIFWTECPEDIADWAMVQYQADGTYNRVRP
jgi:hypothetical protein